MSSFTALSDIDRYHKFTNECDMFFSAKVSSIIHGKFLSLQFTITKGKLLSFSSVILASRSYYILYGPLNLLHQLYSDLVIRILLVYTTEIVSIVLTYSVSFLNMTASSIFKREHQARIAYSNIYLKSYWVQENK